MRIQDVTLRGAECEVVDRVPVYTGKISAEQAFEVMEGIKKSFKTFYAQTIEKSVWRFCDKEQCRLKLTNVINILDKANLMIWDADIMKSVHEGSEAFIGTKIEIKDCDFWPMIWMWNGSTQISNVGLTDFELDQECLIEAWLVYTCEGIQRESIRDALDLKYDDIVRTNRFGIDFVSILQPALNTGDKFDKTKLPFIRAYPALFEREEVTKGYAGLFALKEFLNSEIVVTPQERLSRPYRRRLQKAGITEEPKILHVELRRKVYPKNEAGNKDTKTNEESDSPHYSCQFPVRFHMRKPNSRMKVQRPIFVHEYIKGPKDAPLKVPEKIIFDVRR